MSSRGRCFVLLTAESQTHHGIDHRVLSPKRFVHPRIDGIAPGVTETPLEGVKLFRPITPTPPSPGMYSRSVCVILQGAKQAILEDSVYTYDSTQHLCCAIPMPVQASVRKASKTHPLLGLVLHTDTPVMQDIALRMEPTGLIGSPEFDTSPGICAAEWTPEFALALGRLLSLLDEPELVPVLGVARMQELHGVHSQRPSRSDHASRLRARDGNQWGHHPPAYPTPRELFGRRVGTTLWHEPRGFSQKVQGDHGLPPAPVP